jgi:hypothetical protein
MAARAKTTTAAKPRRTREPLIITTIQIFRSSMDCDNLTLSINQSDDNGKRSERSTIVTLPPKVAQVVGTMLAEDVHGLVSVCSDGK